jgi:predicted metal-binding membrane protein
MVLVCSILILALAAWVALWLTEDSVNSFFHAHNLGHHVHSSNSFILLFVLGWTVMTVAMMLPTSLPVIATFHTLAGSRRNRLLLVVLVIIGYLAVWALFGTVIYLGYLLLQWVLGSIPLLSNHMWAGVPLILILAGAFQFTSLKYRCLDKCRSPFSFVIEHWQGRNYRWQALRLGVDHGIFCVGCCWALMLLMFVVGFGSLGWMFILAVIMAIEKNVSWGRRISIPLGIALIGWGVLLLALSWTNFVATGFLMPAHEFSLDVDSERETNFIIQLISKLIL